jgi:hypothetical protein
MYAQIYCIYAQHAMIKKESVYEDKNAFKMHGM